MKLLIDSDFLFGSLNSNDAHHHKSISLFKQHKKADDIFYITNLVLQEVSTLLSHRMDMDTVRHFHEEFSYMGFEKIYMSEELETSGWEIFLKQTKKGCSFVDCANLAVIEKYAFDGILSFDEFYPKKLRKT